MGISGFQQWLRRSFPEAVQDIPAGASDEFDHVCIDVNHMLHAAAHRSKTPDRLPFALFSELDRILKACRPAKSVVLAVDGPAPIGKICTARKRREVAARKNDDKASLYMQLTPGTELMYEVNNAVQYFICQRLMSMKYSSIKFVFSGSDVPGEGEIKILDYIKTVVAPHEKSPSVVICGGDSDLLLQGLCTPEIRDLFIYIPGGRGATYAVSTHLLTQCVVHPASAPLGALRKLTLRRLVCGHVRSVERQLGRGLSLDFVLICLLSGNDYVPKLPGLGLAKALTRFRRMQNRSSGGARTLVVGAPLSVDWEMFCRLIDKYNMLSRLAKRSGAADMDVPELDSSDELDTDDDSNNGVDDEDDDGDFADEMDEQASVGDRRGRYDVQAYIKGILWNMQMYIDGYPPDQLFAYGYPVAPPIAAVLEYLVAQGSGLYVETPISDAPAVTPNVAMALMLPSSAAALVPEPLRQVVAAEGTDFSYANTQKKAEAIPFRDFAPKDRRRLARGQAYLYMQGRTQGSDDFRLPRPPMNNSKFRAIPYGRVQRVVYVPTSSPPLRTWPGLLERRRTSNAPSSAPKRAFSAYTKKKKRPPKGRGTG